MKGPQAHKKKGGWLFEDFQIQRAETMEGATGAQGKGIGCLMVVQSFLSVQDA